MQQTSPSQNGLSNEEAKIYASNVVRGIQNSVFSSMNLNQNVRSDDTKNASNIVNNEKWRNHSNRSQQEWIVSDSSLQTRDSSCYNFSNMQKEIEFNSVGGRGSLDNNYNMMCTTMTNGIHRRNFKDNQPTTYNFYQHKNGAVYNNKGSNVPLSKPRSNSFEVRPGKKCPACFEVNSCHSNWCMECGKAIISVEIRKYDSIGEPCNQTHAQKSHASHQYESHSLPLWNNSNSPPKQLSYDDQFSPKNLNMMMEHMTIKGQFNHQLQSANDMFGINSQNYNEERKASISFDFENPQFDDFHDSSVEYPRHHAVYRRASHNEKNCKDRENFYPFDDLLYPEFAIYDPNLGYAFPSSNIVSNGAYYQQPPQVYESNVAPPQFPEKYANNKRRNNNRNRSSRNKKKKAKEFEQIVTLADPKTIIKDIEAISLTSNVTQIQDIDNECHWSLPDELILYIFSFLQNKDLNICLRVCKNFNRLATDGNLWKEIKLRKHHHLTDGILQEIAKKKPLSLSLVQCNGKHVTMEGLRFLFRACSDSLEKLDVSCCNGGVFVGESILLHVSARCKNIHTLDVSWSNVSSTSVQSMSQASNRLTNLSLNGCQVITDETIEAIVTKHGESLQTLEVFGCFNISAVSIKLISEHCKNLSKLNVGQCHKITNAAVSIIAKKLNKLKILDLRGCKQIRDSSLRDIASGCELLTTLVIANCPLITDSTLANLAIHLPTLECLDACGCGKISDRGVITLAKNCRYLKMLDLSSTKVTCKSVFQVADSCTQTLTSLKLSFCHSISDQCLRQVVCKCKKLQTIHLYGCKPLRNLSKLMELNPSLKIERESLR